MIEQIVAAVARIAGLARKGQLEEATRALDEAWTSALGLRRADAERLDDATLRMLLGAKADLAAKLLEAQSELEEARGKPAAAVALRERAAKLSGGR